MKNKFIKPSIGCNKKNIYKNTNNISKKIISVPFHPKITSLEMKKITLAIKKFYKK